MVTIKSIDRINFTSQLESEQVYIMVSVRDLNISNDKSKVTAVVVCHKFNYELDEEDNETTTIIDKKLIESKAVVFTKDELDALLITLSANITSMESFDAFQLSILLYLAQRDSYFGITTWESI